MGSEPVQSTAEFQPFSLKSGMWRQGLHRFLTSNNKTRPWGSSEKPQCPDREGPPTVQLPKAVRTALWQKQFLSTGGTSSWDKNLPCFNSVKYRAYLYIYRCISLTMTISPSEIAAKYSVVIFRENGQMTLQCLQSSWAKCVAKWSLLQQA